VCSSDLPKTPKPRRMRECGDIYKINKKIHFIWGFGFLGFWVMGLFNSFWFILLRSRELFTLFYINIRIFNFIKYSLLFLGFWGFFWGFTKILRRQSATLRRTVTRTIALERVGWALLRWYTLYLLHVGGRGDLIPCAGYRLITRNLSPHSPPLKFPPSLRRIYSLTRNIK
jgi:hypothetical protein